MAEDGQRFGLSDAELAAHRTVFAGDAMEGQVAVFSGGAGGIGGFRLRPRGRRNP